MGAVFILHSANSGIVAFVQPEAVFAEFQHVCQIGEEIFGLESQSDRGVMSRAVIRAGGELVRTALEVVSGTKGELRGKVDFRTHTQCVTDAVFVLNRLIFSCVVIFVGVEVGHTKIAEIVFGGDEGVFFDEEGGSNVKFQRRSECEVVAVGV